EPARSRGGRLRVDARGGPPAPGQLRACPIGVDDLRRGHHRVCAGLPRHRHAILHLGAHDPPHAHAITPLAPAVTPLALTPLTPLAPTPLARPTRRPPSPMPRPYGALLRVCDRACP